MPWLQTLEVPTNREGGIGWPNKIEFTREFQVLMSSLTDGAIQVSNVPYIPRYGDPFIDADNTVNFACICYDIRAKQDSEDPFRWHVTCKYATGDRSRYSPYTPERGDQRYNDSNPLNRPASIIWGKTKIQVPFTEGYANAVDPTTGAIITNFFAINSAGDPFSPPAMIEETLPTLTIARNEGGYDGNVAQLFQDTINSDTFFGWPPLTARCEGISARSNVEGQQLYWEVTYEFSFRKYDPPNGKLGWLLPLQDLGFNQIVAGKKKRILDDLARPVVVPWPLNGNGVAQTTGNVKTKYLVFQPYDTRTFGQLNLP